MQEIEKYLGIDEKFEVELYPHIKWLQNNYSMDWNTFYSEFINQSVVLRSSFAEHQFMKDLSDNLLKINSKYLNDTDFELLVDLNIPKLIPKPLESTLIKSYRHCYDKEAGRYKTVLEENNPYLWFNTINDLVRTTMVVKYVDGVKYLCDEIDKIAKHLRLKTEISLESKFEGYYAGHCVIIIPTKLIMDRIVNEYEAKLEIQVTTQTQCVIKSLLHKYYEQHRKPLNNPIQKWEWSFGSDEFSTHYLGHIVHFIEGLIVDIRDKQKTNKK